MTASAASSTTTLTRVKNTLPHYTYAWGFVASVLAQAFEARWRLRWHARRRGCTVCGRAVVEAEAGLYPRAWSVSGHLGGNRNTLHPAGVQNGQEKRGTGVNVRGRIGEWCGVQGAAAAADGNAADGCLRANRCGGDRTRARQATSKERLMMRAMFTAVSFAFSSPSPKLNPMAATNILTKPVRNTNTATEPLRLAGLWDSAAPPRAYPSTARTRRWQRVWRCEPLAGGAHWLGDGRGRILVEHKDEEERAPVRSPFLPLFLILPIPSIHSRSENPVSPPAPVQDRSRSRRGSSRVSRSASGSGGSMLAGTPADLYLRVEMSHHKVLAALAAGTHVILCAVFSSYLPPCLLDLTHCVFPFFHSRDLSLLPVVLFIPSPFSTPFLPPHISVHLPCQLRAN
ncbi:hypothetical protein C8J57DRAFT_1716971 [Mycena rebaudengoi]|nr:hypothetical protein C8J57DRAFT_1716971 [Mycena rebaudengoi]